MTAQMEKKLKRVMPPNAWMVDAEFMHRLDYHDKYYITSLCKAVFDYLKFAPITVLSSWDNRHKSIYITIGDEKAFFQVSPHISYDDYVTRLRRFLLPFYPMYDVNEIVRRKRTPDELVSRRNEIIREGGKLDLNALMEEDIEGEQRDCGIIVEVDIKGDIFKIEVNGNNQIRMSGCLERPMGLSQFQSELRKIKDDTARRDFIFSNSHMVEELPETPKDVFIEYSNEQTYNFFVINYLDLEGYEPVFIKESEYRYLNDKEELISQKQKLYRWAQYLIKFPPDSYKLINDCLSFFNMAKEKQIDTVEPFIIF